MKRLGILVLTGGLLAAAGAFAGAEDEGGGRWRGHGPMKELSAEQRTAMRQAWRAHRDAVTPIKDKLEDELERLRGLVEKAAPEKELAASVDKVKDLHKAIRAEREKLMDKMGASLTPLQRAKGVLAMERRMRGGFHKKTFKMKRGGGPGHGDPHGWGGPGGPGMRDSLGEEDIDVEVRIEADEEGPEHP